MLPGSTYVLLLLGFINFLLGVFYFKKEWAVYTVNLNNFEHTDLIISGSENCVLKKKQSQRRTNSDAPF